MTDAASLVLKRPRPARALISLVAMIDVLLILLVFFMVTSTYLDLDMIPALSDDAAQGQTSADPQPPAGAPVLVRIGEDGQPVIRGQKLSLPELEALLAARLATSPAVPVMILPTGVARTQALVSVMDTATRVGIRNVRVIRLEARP